MTLVDTSKIGRKGGKARLETMTPEERSESARNAAKARWEKEKAGESAAASLMGKKGGAARAKALTKKQRKEIAQRLSCKLA